MIAQKGHRHLRTEPVRRPRLEGAGPIRSGAGPVAAVGGFRGLLRLLLLLVVAVVGLDLVVLRNLVLPARFNLDSSNIQRIASGRASSLGDEAFGNVAAIYRALGLQDQPTAAGLLGYGLALVVVVVVVVQTRFRTTWPGAIALAVAIFMSAVYLGTYSKDVFVLPIVLVVLLVRKGIVGELVVMASLLVYAELFRPYWYLVAGLYAATRLLLLLSGRRWTLVAAAPVALLVLAVAMPLLTGHPSDFARTAVNEARGADDIATMIRPFVDLPEPLGSFVNTELVLVTAIIPLPLLLRGEVYYFVSGAAVLLLWTAFAIGLRRVGARSAAVRGVALIVAFVSAQALFEPDYGSLLRHLTPLLPILCLVAMAPAGVVGAESGRPPGRLDRFAAERLAAARAAAARAVSGIAGRRRAA